MPNPPFGSESWSGSSPADARAAVLSALQSGASAICVIGGAASGKTALARQLAAGVDDRSFSTGLFDAALDPDAVLRQLLSDFGLGAGGVADAAAQSRETLIAAVVRFLKSLRPLGAHALLVVDDADHVGVDVLAALVTIARDAGTGALRLVLVGQPGLEARLVDPPLNQFPGASGRWTRVGLTLDDALVPIIPPESSYVATIEPEPEVAPARASSRRLVPLLALLLVVIAGVGWWWTSRETTPAATAAPPAVPPVSSPPPAAAAPATAAPSSAAAREPVAPPATVTAAGETGEPSARVQATATAGAGPYRITVASFRTAARAQQIATALQAQQLAVTTRADANGTWHQVVAGPYPSIEAARDAQRMLERAGFPDTQIAMTPAAATSAR